MNLSRHACMWACALLLGCGQGGAGEHHSEVSLDALQAEPLRVMTFNIYRDGAMGLAAVVDVIREQGPDLVGLQESWQTTGEIAAALGYYSVDGGVLSRWPISGSSLYRDHWGVIARVSAPGRSILFVNSHLSHETYGPYRQRDGLPLEEGVRAAQIRQLLLVAESLSHNGEPVILTGDHNSPSHLDLGQPQLWPVSHVLAERGFYDTFRVLHRDPVRRPGITWSPGYPGHLENDTLDRIDFIYVHSTHLEVLRSFTLGFHVPIGAWPSDHAAVVSDLEVW